MAVKHVKVAVTPDDGTSEVGTDEWNDDHNIETNTIGDAEIATHNSTKITGLAAQVEDLNMSSNKVVNVTDPTGDQDAATKAYVDNLTQGIRWKQPVRAATTIAGTLATDFENTDVIDGVTLATNDRILIKNQASGSENGIYTVNASGAPTRALDFNEDDEVSQAAVFAQEGTVNADSAWVLTNDGTITIGSTALVFVQFTGLGQITAGTGLDKTGNTLNVDSTVLINGGALGTPSSGTATNITGLPLSTGVIGILPDANMPNLTGDVTTVEGAVATTLAPVKDVNGLQEDVVYAGSMIDADGVTLATAEFTTRYSATNNAPVQSYNFDAAADEVCFIDWRPVKQWDAGTIEVKAVWNNLAGLTTETIELEVSAVAFSDGDVETTAFGTPQNITDTWSAQNTYQESAYSSAITIANTPAKGDLVKIKILRDISADNLTGDLELCKIIIRYSIDAATSV